MNADDHHVPSITSVEELLAYSLAIEREAVDRYSDLADQMEVHNNQEVASLFRKLESIEGKHVDHVQALVGERVLPHIAPWDFAWGTLESPEAVDPQDTHYLMTPHHALTIALEGEKRAATFFERVAGLATDPAVREMAGQMYEEEREHVTLMLEWLRRYPRPDTGWDQDPDPAAAHE